MTTPQIHRLILTTDKPVNHYVEQVAAYNKRKVLMASFTTTKRDTRASFSNSDLPWEKKQALIQMYLLKLLTLQNTITMGRWDLQTDLSLVIGKSPEIIELTIQKHTLWVNEHSYLHHHWKRAFAIEFPDEVADIYRC